MLKTKYCIANFVTCLTACFQCRCNLCCPTACFQCSCAICVVWQLVLSVCFIPILLTVTWLCVTAVQQPGRLAAHCALRNWGPSGPYRHCSAASAVHVLADRAAFRRVQHQRKAFPAELLHGMFLIGNSSSKTSILKDSSVRSIWTYLTASAWYITDTNKHDNTTNK